MASRMLDAYTTQGTHAVGNLNSWKVRVLPNGALVDTASVDNFTLVELGFNAEGERICKQLSAKDKKAYLVASVERRYVDGEKLADFYNGVGDRARIVLLDEGVHFETSAFSLNAGVTEAKKGQVAHFDVVTKKYIVSEVGTPHADFAGSSAQFEVVDVETDLEFTCGVPVIRLEVSKG